MQHIKTRFCPSPTGEIHLGNARTALFCYLLATKEPENGCLLLRIEDTDAERSDIQHVFQLYQDLRWLGIHWHEGPEVEQENGPYFQSERQNIYEKYYQQLSEKGLMYPCFCSQEQLELQRKIQRSRGIPPRYSGTCQNLTSENIQKKLDQGIKPSYRFRVKNEGFIEFEDLVKGSQRFQLADIGDFIIRRADGTAPFLFCNAIDDALMGVTHVLRGEDHLTNTPRQLLILQSLGLRQPLYGHMTLILSNEGSPLSKREGSRSIRQMRERGFFPIAISNYLARLGHYYADNALMSMEHLAQLFSIENLGRSAARFDEVQLQHWQKEAVFHANEHHLWDWFSEKTRALVGEDRRSLFIQCIRGNILFPQDAEHWAELLFGAGLDINAAELKNSFSDICSEYFSIVLAELKHGNLDAQVIFDRLKKQLNLKGKALFHPLRLALTGLDHGPELGKILPLLGEAEAVKRVMKLI